MGFDPRILESLQARASGANAQLMAVFSILPDMMAYVDKIPTMTKGRFIEYTNRLLEQIPEQEVIEIVSEMQESGELSGVVKYSSLAPAIVRRWKERHRGERQECPFCKTVGGFIVVWSPRYLLWLITGGETTQPGAVPAKTFAVLCPEACHPRRDGVVFDQRKHYPLDYEKQDNGLQDAIDRMIAERTAGYEDCPLPVEPD